MTDTRTRPQYDVPIPDRLRGLPRDPRGFIIPYFVAWLADGKEVEPPNGTPDFRVLSVPRMYRCKRLKLCWLCGQKLGVHMTFAIGPMCAATRTTLEPPSHHECAVYAIKVCPFLSRPAMRRNDVDLPEGRSMAGLSIDRNPGVIALWTTRSYRTFDAGKVPGCLLYTSDAADD